MDRDDITVSNTENSDFQERMNLLCFGEAMTNEEIENFLKERKEKYGY